MYYTHYRTSNASASSSSSSYNNPSISCNSILEPPNFVSRMRNFASNSKPQIDIALVGDRPDQWVHTFSTLDQVTGLVSVAAPHDTKFDQVEIVLVGNVRTAVDKMTSHAVNGRMEAFHQFLKLQMPIPLSRYPEPRQLQGQKTYTFPFEFRIPERLLPHSCQHKTNNAKLSDAHLQLPPSIGDPELSGSGIHLLSDLAPEMAKINYAIRVRIVKSRDRDGKEMILAEKHKKIRVVPATDENPPVDIDGKDEEICLRKEKGVKKGLFKSKAGRLVMEAAQPKSLHMPSPNESEARAVTTMATVMLRYDPVDNEVRPPRLGSLSTKLKVATFYSSQPRREFPSKCNMTYDQCLGLHVESVSLSQRCMASAQWTRHEPNGNITSLSVRRDSAMSIPDSSIPAASSTYNSQRPFYVARLLVPITLPGNKCFIPTFHSCLVSRIYILDMSLNVPSAGTGAGVGTSITLKVPVQISSQGSPQPTGGAEADVLPTIEETAHSEDFFVPRSVAPPPERFLRTSSIGGTDLLRAMQDVNIDHASRRASEPMLNAAGGHSMAAAAVEAPPEYSYFTPRGGNGVVGVMG